MYFLFKNKRQKKKTKGFNNSKTKIQNKKTKNKIQTKNYLYIPVLVTLAFI